MMTPRIIRLVNELRKNCRKSLTVIGSNAGIPLSSVFKMMIKIEKGTVRKNVTLVDFAQLGFPYKVGIFLTTDKKDELKKFFARHPNLNTLLRLSGDHDFYAELMFKHMASVQDFADELKDTQLVKNISMHFAADIKQEEFEIGDDKHVKR